MCLPLSHADGRVVFKLQLLATSYTAAARWLTLEFLPILPFSELCLEFGSLRSNSTRCRLSLDGFTTQIPHRAMLRLWCGGVTMVLRWTRDKRAAMQVNNSQ